MIDPLASMTASANPLQVHSRPQYLNLLILCFTWAVSWRAFAMSPFASEGIT